MALEQGHGKARLQFGDGAGDYGLSTEQHLRRPRNAAQLGYPNERAHLHQVGQFDIDHKGSRRSARDCGDYASTPLARQ
ncbi:hypothetical protein D3C75_999580 [compost metagenome]